MTAVSSSNKAAERGSKIAGDMILKKFPDFQVFPMYLSNSGSGRFRAFFSVSGIDRSNKLQVLEKSVPGGE